jgi:hypothetical protein
MNSDARGQSQALAVLLRVEREIAERLERRDAAEREAKDASGTLTIEKLDQLVRDFTSRPKHGICYACGQRTNQSEETHEVTAC